MLNGNQATRNAARKGWWIRECGSTAVGVEVPLGAGLAREARSTESQGDFIQFDNPAGLAPHPSAAALRQLLLTATG